MDGVDEALRIESREPMKPLTYILAAFFALVAVLLLVGAAGGAGIGPVELIVALVPLAIAAVLINSARRN